MNSTLVDVYVKLIDLECKYFDEWLNAEDETEERRIASTKIDAMRDAREALFKNKYMMTVSK